MKKWHETIKHRCKVPHMDSSAHKARVTEVMKERCRVPVMPTLLQIRNTLDWTRVRPWYYNTKRSVTHHQDCEKVTRIMKGTIVEIIITSEGKRPHSEGNAQACVIALHHGAHSQSLDLQGSSHLCPVSAARCRVKPLKKGESAHQCSTCTDSQSLCLQGSYPRCPSSAARSRIESPQPRRDPGSL